MRSIVRALSLEAMARPAPLATFAIGCGLLLFVAGTVFRPPFGGLVLLAGVLAACGAAVLLIARPGWFLAAFLVYATFAPFLGRIFHLPLGWLKGSLFLLVLPLWLLSRIIARQDRTTAEARRIPLICFAAAAALIGALALVSAFRGIPSLQILNSARGTLLYPPLMFVALEATGNRRLVRRFLYLALGLTAIVALGALLQSFLSVETLLRLGLWLETGAVVYIAIDPISGKVYQRVFSILDDQSSVAAFAFVGIVLSIYLLLSKGNERRRAFLLPALGLNGYALLLTYNMTTLVGTFLFFLILAFRRRSPRLIAGFLLVTLLVAGIASIRFGDLIRNRLATSFSVKTGVSTSLAVRIKANQEALLMVKDSPIIGQGLGATSNFLIYYRLGMRSSFEGGFPTDNYYMTTTLEGGVIGLSAILLLHILPLWGMAGFARSRDPDRRLFAQVIGSAVIVFLLMNFSNGQMNTNPTNLLYWSLAGLVWRLSRERHESPLEGARHP